MFELNVLRPPVIQPWCKIRYQEGGKMIKEDTYLQTKHCNQLGGIALVDSLKLYNFTLIYWTLDFCKLLITEANFGSRGTRFHVERRSHHCTCWRTKRNDEHHAREVFHCLRWMQNLKISGCIIWPVERKCVEAHQSSQNKHHNSTRPVQQFPEGAKLLV